MQIAGFPHRRPSSGPNAKALLVAGIALLALLPAWWMLLGVYANQQLAAERSRLADVVAPYRDALVRSVERRFALLDALRAFVRSNRNPGALRAYFDGYASGLYSSSRGIRALELMPGGITDFVYPLAGNEKILGHDILRDPRPVVAEEVQRNLKTGRITVTDPLELWQGGTGMVARQSIFTENGFWGFVAVVVDFPEFLSEAGLAKMPRGLQLGLKDRSGRIIYGSAGVWQQEPIVQALQLAEGQWKLAAVPADGWSGASRWRQSFTWITLAMVGLLSMLAYFITERQSHLSLAVREGDERYRAVTDAVPVVIAYVDRDERYQFSNRASQQWFDRSGGDPNGKHVRDVLGAETYRRVEPEIKAALAGKQTNFEMTSAGLDGGLRHLRAVCIPRLLGGRQGNGFYLLITDVSDLKLAERAAIDSRDFLQRLLDDFPALVWRSGPDGECRYFNRSWLEFTGHTLETEGWEASVHPEDQPKRAAAYRQAFEARQPFQMEYRLRRHDAGYRTVLDIAKPFIDASGNLEGYVGSCFDITDRERAEEALKQTNRALETIIQASPLSIVMIAPEGRVLSWNQAATAMFGYSEEEALGEFLPMAANEDQADFERRFARARHERLVGVECRWQRKDGSSIDVDIWTAPMRDENGKTVAIMCMHADISARKQLEEQFRQSQKMEAIGRLAGGVAHDFNNLLSVISGYGHMLGLALPEDESLHRDLQEILKAGDRASDLTKQLLAFSRRQVVQPKVIDLNACIGSMEHMLHRLIGEDIELRILLDRGLGQIHADPGQIEQVIMNLAVNARDAMPRGGVLTIETANVHLGRTTPAGVLDGLTGDFVMIAVVDTGTGMDAETQSHVFEPFFTTKEKGKGTGLGLSTVYGIVKQSNGDIRLYSQPGRGATFLVYFPRIDAPMPPEPAAQMPAAGTGQETILVVEDEPGVRELVREVLQRSGYSVLEASNAGEALLICEQHPSAIHLMLSDVVMPKMGGGELAKRLAPLRPEMRVVFMSGYMDDAILRHGVQNDGLAFIQKPLAPGTLVRKIREVLDAPAMKR